MPKGITMCHPGTLQPVWAFRLRFDGALSPPGDLNISTIIFLVCLWRTANLPSQGVSEYV